MSTLCESAAMDAAACLDDGGDVPPLTPCDELGEIDHSGYMLCPGCYDALRLFLSLGARLRRPPEAA